MIKYPSRVVCQAMTLIVLLTFSAGCVKRMSAVNEPGQAEASGFATLRSVTVSPDASRVELASDKPFTYTSYKAGEPAKIIVDISQTEPGSVASPIKVNRGNVRSIELVRQPVGGGVLTRVEISLVRDADFSVATDPSDKTRLLVSLMGPEPDAKPQASEPREAPLAEAKIEEKNLVPEPPATTRPAALEIPARVEAPVAARPAAVPAPLIPETRAVLASSSPASAPGAANSVPAPGKVDSGRRLTAVITAPDGVDLAIEGGVQTFNSFKLSKPDRIVLDLFGMKSAVGRAVVPIGALGIANARIGTTPDKVRIVLDAMQESLPPFEVVKSDLGLKIRLKPQTAVAAAAPPAVPAAQRYAPPAPEAAEAIPAPPRSPRPKWKSPRHPA